MTSVRHFRSLVVAAALLAARSAVAAEATATPTPTPAPPDYAALMAQAKKFTAPGPAHEELRRFLGTWNTEMRFVMGTQVGAPEKGTTECSWLMEGRWIKCDASGAMMGAPTRIFWIMGYDNMKMSYVTTTVSSVDTAMNRWEGDMDPGGQALISYGTLDEYLTGEHDKMVKYVWRFPSPDRMVLEVHDLPIGETGTKVLEVTYARPAP
jgi:hypothetical protein